MTTTRGSPRRDDLLLKVDELIEILASAGKSRAVADGVGPVGLQCALDCAQGLRAEIAKTPPDQLAFSDRVASLAYIVKVVHEVYSLFSCKLVRGSIYATWINHKAIAHCQWHVTNGARRAA